MPLRRGSRGLTLVDVVVGLTLVGLVLAFTTAMAASQRCTEGADARTRCSNHLRQIGMAALQYADDRGGLLPHLAAADRLDGGFDSDTAPRVMNLLYGGNYLDDPGSFVCPASDDVSVGRGMPLDVSVLRKNAAVSYGWTRRELRSNGVGSTPVAGDKARRSESDDEHACCDPGTRGNHRGFHVVVALDAHVTRVRPDDEGLNSANLSATSADGGALGVIDEAR